MGHVKGKGVFKYLQNTQIPIILRTRKVAFVPFFAIDISNNIQQFY